MNHNKSYRKLGRRSDHRLAMLKNMTISLVKAERIETTLTRAKELRKFVEKAITLGKKANSSDDAARKVHLRRQAFAFLRNEEAVAKIFNEIAPKYAERNGGYTRIIKTGFRPGDAADTALIELVDFNDIYNPNEAEKKTTRRSRRSTAKKETAPVAETSEAKVEETPAAENSTEEKTEE